MIERLKEGLKSKKGAVLCGSHLDSVMNGGQFDGVLGVFGAIEAIRRLNDEGYENERPLEVVVFTDEEGSAFGLTLLDSTALVGKMSIVYFVNKRAKEMVAQRGSSTVGTIGKMNVLPSETNIVPGRVELGIDIRDVVQINMDSLKK